MSIFRKSGKRMFEDEAAVGCIEPILANWSACLPDMATAIDTLVCNGIVKMLVEAILKIIGG